ncbi:MAG TPA: lysophospholipase [Kofleriaceae bacterium]|nr:lysophospholipase [Kofleriaceae bacterium]
MRAWLALVALAACGGGIDPGVRTTLPHPEVANADHGELVMEGSIYGQWWRPRGDVKAVLVVQHGLNDHGDRYAHLASTLVDKGYAVYAMDLRGHGRSAGPRDEIDHFERYVDDEHAWIAAVKQKEPGKPIFVFGHSMGGVIMIRYAEEHGDEIAGVILSAPAIGIDAPPLQAAAIGLAGHLGSPGKMLPQRDADFTRIPDEVAAMGKDPLLPHGDGPTHTAVELVGAIERAWYEADHFTAPLIVLHGSADKLTSPAASRDFVARVASTDKRHVLIAGAWHDIAHDPARDEFEGDIAAWLDAHVGGASLPPPAAEPEHIKGERTRSATAVELAGVSQLDPAMETWGRVAARASLGAFYHAELDLAIRDGVGAELLPIGVAGRLGRAGEIALSGGVGAGWPGTWSDVEIPVRVSLELPFGPSHFFANATWHWFVRGPAPDSISAMAALRFGGDHDYWSRVSAGAGPFAGVTYAHSDGIDTWGVTLGLHLWGVD